MPERADICGLVKGASQTVIYEYPTPRFGGPCKGSLVTNRMFRELFDSRGLIWRLFVRDFIARYRQSLLGILWALLMPLLTVGMFVTMNYSGLFRIRGVQYPYPLFAVIGVSIWSLFSGGLSACSQSLVNAGSMVVKINFPKTALVIAASGQAVVELIIRGVLVMAMSAWYGIVPSPTGVIVSLCSLVPLCLMMLGCGFILSLCACVVRDTLAVLNVVLMAFMFMTPILYPVDEGTLLAQVNHWNPLNYLVNLPRSLVMGDLDVTAGFWWSSLVAIAVFFVGWRLFFLAQVKIAERV